MYAVRTYCNGEAAKRRRTRTDYRGNQYSHRVRRSDGLESRVLHVYRLRHSTTDVQLQEIFGAYGFVEEILLYRLQFALVVYRWVQDAVNAKRELDLYQTQRDGSYVYVLLREVQFVNGQPSASARPFDKLRVDFALPTTALTVKTNPELARKMLTNPWAWSAWSEQQDRPVVEGDNPGPMPAARSDGDDDFLDDSVFEDPGLKAVLAPIADIPASSEPAEADDFLDDSVFEDPGLKAVLAPIEDIPASSEPAEADDFLDDSMFNDPFVIASLTSN